MLSSESLQIRSYLFANKNVQSAPASLTEQRAWFDMMVEKYAGHQIPLPEGTRVESVNVDGIPAEWIYPTDADAERAMNFVSHYDCDTVANLLKIVHLLRIPISLVRKIKLYDPNPLRRYLIF